MVNLYDDPILSDSSVNGGAFPAGRKITTGVDSSVTWDLGSGSEGVTSGISMFNIRTPAIMPLLVPSDDAV